MKEARSLPDIIAEMPLERQARINARFAELCFRAKELTKGVEVDLSACLRREDD